MSKAFIAIDLGAESGRVVALTLRQKSQKFELHEAHRFSTNIVTLPSGLHWDVTAIWREIITGLILVAGWAEENDHEICSLGVDSWGVDWGIVDSLGELLGLPHAYRDPRNNKAYETVTEQISAEQIYQLTGIQMMPINSLYSLFALASHSPDLVAAGNHFLHIPDLFHYFLSGVLSNERTIASTSQLLDIHTGNWCEQLLDICDVNADLFSTPVAPGTVLGTLRKPLAAETGLPPSVKVVAPATHDTASAVAAIPASKDRSWCFISSGTWSLVGAEVRNPCLTDEAAAKMFTNEAGVDGTIRFLKNIGGLWLVQQCRRAFADRGQTYTYEELTDIAKLAEPFRTIIDPDHAPFATPGKMLQKINDFAALTKQSIPETPGDYLRCCLESLALAYRQTIHNLESVLNENFDDLHIVGGGGKNQLLNQMTANASGKTVIVGPIEATSLGNSMVQAMALGEISDLDHLRKIVSNTVQPEHFQPQETEAWDQAYEHFLSLPGRE